MSEEKEEKTTIRVDNFRGTAEAAVDLLNSIVNTIEQGDKYRRIQVKLTVKEL